MNKESRGQFQFRDLILSIPFAIHECSIYFNSDPSVKLDDMKSLTIDITAITKISKAVKILI